MATLGALVGFGRAHGGWLQPVNAVAHPVLGTRALLLDGFEPAVTGTALVIHLLAIGVWAFLFTLVAGSRRGAGLVIAAAVFTASVFVIDQHLLPATFAPGFERVLSTSETVVVYITLALALVVGARLGALERDDA